MSDQEFGTAFLNRETERIKNLNIPDAQKSAMMTALLKSDMDKREAQMPAFERSVFGAYFLIALGIALALLSWRISFLTPAGLLSGLAGLAVLVVGVVHVVRFLSVAKRLRGD